jgi:hypothetical protein
MPLIQPAVAVLRAFQRGLMDLAGPNDPALALLRVVQEGHQVYTLGLTDILAGRGIGAATLAGWQFLAADPDNSVAAHVTSTLGDLPPAISSISNGPEIAKAIDAVNAAKAMPVFQQPGGELRLLKIPGVLVEAVWLKPAFGDGEVYPYLTLAKGLDAMRWYPAQEFLNILKPVATEFIVSATVSAPSAKQ